MHKTTKFDVGVLTKRPSGITLIALVITIVVLIILAGVAINLTLGENGIFNKAKYAKEEYKKAEAKEKIELAILDVQTEKMSKGEQCTIDTLVAELPNKLDGMMIAKDGNEAKGVLDGYDFIIEENFNVIIGTRTTVKVLSITFSDPTWTGGTATIQITSNVTGTIEYQKNGPADGNWTEGTTVSGLVHGDKVYAKVTDSEGDTSPVREIEIKDEVAPSQASISTSGVTYEKITVTITTASTDSQTGLKNYTYVAEKADGTKVEIKNQTALTATITGLSEQTDYKIYVIAYDNVGNEKKSNEVAIKTEAMPVSRLFGQYVNYGIDLDSNGNTTDDWQIFYKNDNGDTFIIADYYVPVSKMTASISNAGMTQYSGSTYRVYWNSVPTYQSILDGTDITKPNVKQIFMYDYTGTSNDNVKCVSTLLNPDNWKDDFVTTQLQEKGGLAIGSPTINMWCASWNKAYPTEKITPSIPDGGTGYQVNGSTSVNLTSYTGYKTDAPNVYFPKKSQDSDGSYGYWLASPSSNYSSALVRVHYDCNVNSNFFNSYVLGVRPLVYLPSSITLEPSGTANVWNINYGE